MKKKIEIPIYGGEITIIQTDNFNKVERKYNLQSTHGMSACVFRTFRKDGYIRYFILFKNKVDNSVIAHECLHIVNYILSDCKIYLDAENDEPQCYLLGWEVSECHKFLNVL